jgi:hypothetical protein
MGRVNRTARAQGTATAGSGGGRPLRRTLLASAATVALGGCCVAGLATASPGGDGETLSPRPEPPSAAEVEAAIEHALDREREEMVGSAVRERSATGKTDHGAATSAKRPRRRSLFPQNRVVSLYGLPGGFGVLGRKSANGANRKIRKQARRYVGRGRPVVRAFDMVATVATSCNGRRDKCRTRVPDRLVRRYLREARDLHGYLLLDIQPARSTYIKELEHWRNFLIKPNVGLAIDPEWDVGRRGRPGETVGSSGGGKVNRLSRRLQRMIEKHRLPPKPLVVHQFRPTSVKRHESIRHRPKVDVTLNFDGIGAPKPKRRGYRQLAERRLFNGFSLFYQLDTNLMGPRRVVRLRPRVDYVMYQ